MRPLATILALALAAAGNVHAAPAASLPAGWQRAARAPTVSKAQVLANSALPKAFASDPTGDTFNPGFTPTLDLTGITGNLIGSEIELILTFTTPAGAPALGPEDLVIAYIDIDSDGLPGEEGNSGVSVYCDPSQRPAIGADFYVGIEPTLPRRWVSCSTPTMRRFWRCRRSFRAARCG
jgi:hypothetical protein